MKDKTKKRLAGGVAIVSMLALLLSSTYAWQDFRQHSTNVFEAKDKPDVRLNDEYKPPQHWNTTLNSVVDKKVSVSNTQNSTAPVFVRLRFSEYMETFDVKYDEFIMDGSKPVLFATYASGPNIGEYLRWDSEAEAISGLATMGLNLIPYAVDEDDDTLTADKWFAQTQNEELQNGVYGKPMNLPGSVKKDTSVKLYGGVAKQPLVQDIHKDTDVPYLTHKWDGTSLTYKTATETPTNYYVDPTTTGADTIANYIKWNMGANVISYDD